MIRTILVTEVKNRITQEEKEIYGRYDPVTLERNQWAIIKTYSRRYEMSDEEFVKHAKVKER